jgi:hypothetical protein
MIRNACEVLVAASKVNPKSIIIAKQFGFQPASNVKSFRK